MALNDIIFEKTNGGMGRPAANEDIISGLIMALEGDLPYTDLEKVDKLTGEMIFETIGRVDDGDGINDGDLLYVAKLNYYEQLSTKYGIKAVEVKVPEEGEEKEDLSLSEKACNTIDYHVREFFRMSPTGILYLAIRLGDEVSKKNIKDLQYYAGGLLRQVGILTKTTDEHETYQEACSELFEEHQPLSVIMTYSGTKTEKSTLNEELKDPNTGEPVLDPSTQAPLTTEVTVEERVPAEFLSKLTNKNEGLVLDDLSNVSVLVGCDLDPKLEERIGYFSDYGCIGTALGAISKAAVHECIAWVQKFPLKLKQPGFITGELLKNVSMGDLDLINTNRYIFVRTHVGNANNYFNDSHTLDVPTSDYAYIENVRTMDKATRGIRKNLLPYLNAPLYVDASTGNLRPDMVAFLETTAGRALEDMEKAGELSGYIVVIDPAQNVLATSELEVQIKQVPVGVMRIVKIKIGYTTSI